jgi:cytochrome c-type biogenesis protein CcmH/NrfF
MRRISLTAVASLLAVLALSAPAGAAEPQASLPDIEDEVMCTVCGVPLELATESPQAAAERRFINKLIAQGKTKDEIKDALVAQYGDSVLAVPGDSGFDLAAWLVPGLGILLAAGAIAVGVTRWRRSTPTPEAAADLPPEDAKRLEEDLGRYEL